MVRVLIVSRGGAVWGAELRLLQSGPALRERGVELVLASPQSGNAFADAWVDAGLVLVPLPQAGSDELRRADGSRLGPVALTGVAVRAVARGVRLARLARGYDVVLSSSRHAHVEVALAGRLARRPVVVEIVDIVRPGLGRRALRAAARLARVVVANSRATGTTVEGAARDLRVIYPGVDTDVFSPGAADPAMRARLGGRPDGPVIGILGRLDPDKGIETVVEAIAIAGDSGRHPRLAAATLAVVGGKGVAPDAYVDGLQAESARRLGDRVTFTGRIDDVPAVLRTLDVLVSASHAEPFGLTVLEAQATGASVVAAEAGGIPEFVIDGQTGLLFPPGNAAALADALERIVGDHALAASIAAAGREQAEDRFANDGIFDAWAALYCELAG